VHKVNPVPQVPQDNQEAKVNLVSRVLKEKLVLRDNEEKQDQLVERYMYTIIFNLFV